MSDNKAAFDPDPDLYILEALANRHPLSSSERAAVELAAKALLFIHATRQADGFATYLGELDAELSDEQREHLAQMGLR
jgi:hypothetical protein